MAEERFFLYDEQENTMTRFISFMGENQRFDLGIMQTERFFGKSLVFDLQGEHFAIIGRDDLENENYVKQAFRLNKEDAQELHSFLLEVIHV